MTVVIRGFGALTPFGNENAAFVDGIMGNESAVAPLPEPLAGTRPGVAGLVQLTNRDLLKLPHCRGLRPGTMTRYTFLSTGALALCLGDAGIDELPDEDAGRRGVYCGTYTNSSEVEKYARLALATADPDARRDGRFEFDSSLIPSAMKRFTGFEFLKLMNNMPTAHGSIHAKCQGPCQSFLGNPLAGLHAVGQGTRALQMDLADTLFAGGTGSASMDAMLILRDMKGWLAPRPDSSDQLPAVAFDEHGAGTIPGEGAAFVALGRTDGDGPVRAYIHGFATAWVGRGEGWSVELASDVIGRALAEAQWDAASVDIVTALGMGHQENDQRELQTLQRALGDARPPLLTLTRRIGFLEAAHGNVLLAAIVHALSNQCYPALEVPEHPLPGYDFALQAPDSPPRRALVFGAEPGGQVVALAVGVDAPA